MKSIEAMQNEVVKLYQSMELGNFFNTYHDLLLSLLEDFDYLENDEIDLKIGKENLEKAKAIIKAQKTLNKVKIK